LDKDIVLRWASRADYPTVADVIYDAVRNGPSLYSEAQRQQWAPERRSGPEWVERLDSQAVILAEDETGVIGLMSLADGGYIDFAYIRPHVQGSGIFRAMFGKIAARASESGQMRLWLHASLMAQPAFAAVGFRTLEKEIVAIGTEQLERFVMERTA
jgi:putative acetyltransferase